MLGIIAILIVMIPCAYKIGYAKGRVEENKLRSGIHEDKP